MTPKKIADSTAQVAVRLDERLLGRADALVATMARPGFVFTRAEILRAAITRGIAVLEAEKSARSESFDDPAMSFEEAIRYVHDRCGRFEADGDATADKFTLAMQSDNWASVGKALSRATRVLYADASYIKWSEEERANGGLRPNFESALERASSVLDRAATPHAAYLAVSLLVTALKAAILKASGKVPKVYRGRTA